MKLLQIICGVAGFVILATVTGCSTVPVSREVRAPITIPDPPKRFAWYEEGVPEKPGTIYLDPYRRLNPDEQVKAPADGGILITPKAWRGIKYGITEWPRWGDIVQSIVKAHNDAIRNYRRDDDNTWARILRWKF